MNLIAHRGFADRYPENTLLAVREAAAVADAIEVDVRRCGSGELVVFHDERLDRLTDGEGPVAETDLADLRALSVLDTDQSVPTLDAVLDAVPADVGLVVDLKDESGDLPAAAARRAADAAPEVWVSAHETGLAAAREAAPSVPRALLFRANFEDALALAADLDCAAVHPNHRLCDPAAVARAHEAGLDVNAWTVDDAATARRLADAGVDGLIADDPDVLPRQDPG